MRFWRSVKYEEVYPRAYDNLYNGRRPHSSLDGTHARSSLIQLAAFPRGGLTPAEAPIIDAEISVQTTAATSVVSWIKTVCECYQCM